MAAREMDMLQQQQSSDRLQAGETDRLKQENNIENKVSEMLILSLKSWQLSTFKPSRTHIHDPRLISYLTSPRMCLETIV